MTIIVSTAVEKRTMVAVPKKAGRWAINMLDPGRLETVIPVSKWKKGLIS